MFDTIIIGAGPAGMGASIYSARSGLNTLLLDESVPGGLLNKISIVANYLGYKSINGSDLALDMYNHVKNENVTFKLFKDCRHEIMLEKNKDEVHNYVLDWLDNNL